MARDRVARRQLRLREHRGLLSHPLRPRLRPQCRVRPRLHRPRRARAPRGGAEAGEGDARVEPGGRRRGRCGRCSSPASRRSTSTSRRRATASTRSTACCATARMSASRTTSGYITNEHAFVSLASIETRFGGAGNRGRGRLGRGAQLAQAGGRAAPSGHDPRDGAAGAVLGVRAGELPQELRLRRVSIPRDRIGATRQSATHSVSRRLSCLADWSGGRADAARRRGRASGDARAGRRSRSAGARGRPACAASGSRATIASMIAACSSTETFARWGRDESLNWWRTLWACRRPSTAAAVAWRLSTRTRWSSCWWRRAYSTRSPSATASIMSCRSARNSCDLIVRDLGGGLGGTESLDADAHLEDLDRLVHRDRPHPRALVGQALHEPLVGEFEQRDAHGRAARGERVAQVGLDQALVRGVLAAHDRAADHVGHALFGGRIRALRRSSTSSLLRSARGKIQPLLSTI